MLSGSLGRDAGTNGVYFQNYEQGPASGKQASDANADFQIIQMGANIIDQSDADSYPTEIHFADANNGSAETQFFGIENLPYLQRVFAKTLYNAFTDTTSSDPNQMVAGWFMAELWNPHQNWGMTAATTPTQFKFCGGGPTQMWDSATTQLVPTYLETSGSINFTVPASSTICREVTLLSNDSTNGTYLAPTSITSGSNGTNDPYGTGLVAGLYRRGCRWALHRRWQHECSRGVGRVLAPGLQRLSGVSGPDRELPDLHHHEKSDGPAK